VSSSSAAVLVANSTDVNGTLFTTSKRVLLSWDMSICCQCEKIGTESRLSRQLINSTVIIHRLMPIFLFQICFFSKRCCLSWNDFSSLLDVTVTKSLFAMNMRKFEGPFDWFIKLFCVCVSLL